MEICHTRGCKNTVSTHGHKLCYNCWKKQQMPVPEKVSSSVTNIFGKASKAAAIASPILSKLLTCESPTCKNIVKLPGMKLCTTCQEQSGLLTATNIGENFRLEGKRVNSILSELGWIIRAPKGWRASSYSKATLGAIERVHPKSGVPYVLWKKEILNNPILCYEVGNFTGRSVDDSVVTNSNPKANSMSGDFRTKFNATFRSTDGHMVRSKAEMLIDNWLYMSGIIHAYERKLPVEEEIYCDFYLPRGKVYIEYWGLENDPAYRARKEEKKRIYKKYNFGLIELSDNEVKNLDDYLPRFLLKFNIVVD